MGVFNITGPDHMIYAFHSGTGIIPSGGRNILLAVFILLFFQEGLWAQRPSNVELWWGTEQKKPGNTRIYDVFGVHPGGFFAVQVQGRRNPRFFLERYNDELDREAFQELDLGIAGSRRSRNFTGVIYHAGELVLLSTMHFDREGRHLLYRERLDPVSLLPVGSPEVIREITLPNPEGEVFFDYRISRDSSKVLILPYLPEIKDTQQQIALEVWDSALETLLWRKTLQLPNDASLFDIRDVKVDDYGNVFVLGIEFEEERQFSFMGKPNYTYQLISCRALGTEVQVYRIGLEDRFLSDMVLELNPEGDVIIAGFYSEKGAFSAKGVGFFRIDGNTGEVVAQNVQAFGDELTASFLGKTGGRKDRELYGYDLSRLILRADGGAVLVAEQFFRQERTFRTYTGTTFRYDAMTLFFYQDIIVISLDPDGAISWETRVPKYQQTVNDEGYFSSFALGVVNDKLHLVYNDHPKNILNGGVKRLKSYNGRNSIVNLATVSRDGSLEQLILYSNKVYKVLTRPVICKQISRDELIIFGERNKKCRFGRIRFR
jgi:hypothetical protein